MISYIIILQHSEIASFLKHTDSDSSYTQYDCYNLSYIYKLFRCNLVTCALHKEIESCYNY